ncbi:hypothetical protein NGRA_0889 [Nosema granulosis]|uniref:Uncharacterized protein n=1 Tax=Nosema granulosis TaxID=83296 RepID=A0A9P6GZH5_9MICR|nr:hypothetical protein NGRA_0889 [Nosema granulosis]
MFFLSKIYNKKDLHKKVLAMEDNIFYLGNSSLSKFKLTNYDTTKYFFTIILDAAIFKRNIIVLTYDSLLVLDENLEETYKYPLEKKYTQVINYNHLLILHSTFGDILVLHIHKMKFYYPLTYTLKGPIFDLKFYESHLYVLTREEIIILEYSGQFLEYKDCIKHEGVYRLEEGRLEDRLEEGRLEDRLLVFRKDGILKLTNKTFSFQVPLNRLIVSTNRINGELFLLDEDGVILDTKGKEIYKVNISKDFAFTNELLFTVGFRTNNCVYKNGELLQSFQSTSVISEAIGESQRIELQNKIILSKSKPDSQTFSSSTHTTSSSTHTTSSSTHTNSSSKHTTSSTKHITSSSTYTTSSSTHITSSTFSSSTHTFLLKEDTLWIDKKSLKVDYYDYKFTGDCLILISKEEVCFFDGFRKQTIKTKSRNVLFSPQWIICSFGKNIKFINIHTKRLEYFQILRGEIMNIFLSGEILIYNTREKSFFSILQRSPTPPVEIEEKVEYCGNGIICTTKRILDLEDCVSYSLSEELGAVRKMSRIAKGDRKYLLVNGEKEYELISKATLIPQKISNGSELAYDLGDYQCVEFGENEIYVGYSDHIMVYKIGKKNLLKKYRILVGATAIKISQDLLFVAISNGGIATYKNGIKISEASISLVNFIVAGEKIYGYSKLGVLYILLVEGLNTVGCMYVGELLSIFKEADGVYFITDLGEVGEVIEVDSQLRKVCNLEYFSMFPRQNMYDVEFLRRNILQENKLKPIEKSELLHSIIFSVSK